MQIGDGIETPLYLKYTDIDNRKRFAQLAKMKKLKLVHEVRMFGHSRESLSIFKVMKKAYPNINLFVDDSINWHVVETSDPAITFLDLTARGKNTTIVSKLDSTKDNFTVKKLSITPFFSKQPFNVDLAYRLKAVEWLELKLYSGRDLYVFKSKNLSNIKPKQLKLNFMQNKFIDLQTLLGSLI